MEQRVFPTICLSGLILVLFVSCSGSGSNEPVSTPLILHETARTALNTGSSSHHLCLYRSVHLDLDAGTAEVTIDRHVMDHFNVLEFMETAPCTDCVQIVKVAESDHGTVLVDVQLTHPFPGLPMLTGFDVRGLVMFDGSKTWPGSELTMSDRDSGDPELINPDGHTALYNYTTEGAGVYGWKGYIPGAFASHEAPDALLNAFIRYQSDDPENTRNAFYADDSIIRTYDIALPASKWVFGYAVDASWDIPLVEPVTDPMTDFPIEANCTEAWKVEITEEPIGQGLTDAGGSVRLYLDFYDWQGPDDIHNPLIVCPELFDGAIEADWVEDFDDYSRYDVRVDNDNLAAEGEYRCLVSKEAAENNPDKPWLDLTCYKVHRLSVARKFNLVDVTPPWLNFSPEDICVDGPYAFIAGFDNGLHLFDVTDPSDPSWVNRLELPRQTYAVDVSGGYAFVANALNGLEIVRVGPSGQLEIVKSVEVEGWPIDVKVVDNYAYLVTASFLYMINIEDIESAFVENAVGPIGFNPRIDVQGGYAFVTENGGESQGLHIFDVDPAADTYEVKYMLLSSPYGVCAAGEYLYVADGVGVRIIKLNSIINAEEVILVPTPGAAFDVTVQYGYAFVADGLEGLQVLSLDPPEAAQVIKSVPTPGNAYRIDFQDALVYIADEASGLVIMDVNDIDSAYVRGTRLTPGTPRHVSASGDNLYVADRRGEVQAVDFDPVDAISFGTSIDVSEDAVSVRVVDNTAYVLDWPSPGGGSLHIVDISDPDAPNIVKTLYTGSTGWSLDVVNGYAYVSASGGLRIFDVDPPESAEEVADVAFPHNTFGSVIGNGYAYTAAYQGAYIVDIDPVESAYYVGPVGEGEFSRDVAIHENYLLVLGNGLSIYDIQNPESPQLIKTMDESGFRIEARDGYAYIAAIVPSSDTGLDILDIDPPEQAHQVARMEYDAFYYARGLALSGEYAFLSVDRQGIRIISLW